MINEFIELIEAVAKMRSLQSSSCKTKAMEREIRNTEATVDRLIQDGKEKLNICYPKK